jgi:hypothetical protein
MIDSTAIDKAREDTMLGRTVFERRRVGAAACMLFLAAGAGVYLAWDAEALLAGAEVTDDRHVNARTGAEILNGDAMHVALVNAKGIHWNLALALTAGGVVLHQFEGRDEALLKTADCAVARDEPAGITRYGLRLPLAVLGLPPGTTFGLSVQFSDDDDGGGRRHWLQLAPGLAGLHDVRLYPRFILAKEDE